MLVLKAFIVSVSHLDRRSAVNHSAADGHLVCNAIEGPFGEVFRNATDLVQDRSGFHNGDPVFRFAFSLTHSSFERFARNRLIWEDSGGTAGKH